MSLHPMTSTYRIIFFAGFLFYATGSVGQPVKSVQWFFNYEYLNRHEAILIITARIAPGWHLYSQYMEEGGPQRTRIEFKESSDFILVGKAEEKGNRDVFHDELYEMEIAWFSGEVSFEQRIYFTKPQLKVQGMIEYMTCDNHMCVPARQAIYFDLHR